MVFNEYINSLPNIKAEKIKAIAENCRVTDLTVWRWITGKTQPDALKKKIIAETLGVSEDELTF